MPAAATENCLVGETLTHGVRSITLVVSESHGDTGGRLQFLNTGAHGNSVIIIRMPSLSSSPEDLACGWMFLRWTSSTWLQDGPQRSQPLWFWSPQMQEEEEHPVGNSCKTKIWGGL